ncbi:MAG TPA: UbiA family prenyltransferase [Tepidiformaceae bacterium]|nr:UbiA family prenyltransferase [Tepidiformaceae bacterium]
MSATTTDLPHGFASSRLRVLHPFPSFLVAALTVAIVPFADPDAPVSLYVALGLGMLLYQFAIGVANDITDAPDDAQNKPWKPIARGAITLRAGKLLVAGLAGAGLLVTSGLDPGAWLIGLAGLSAGLAYDVHFKRTRLSWLPWAIAFPLIPVWVYTAADAWDDLLWWVFPLGAMLAVALYFANQAPGADAEREVGGLAQQFGERASRAAGMALFGLTSSIAVVVLLVVARPQAMLAAIAAAVTVVLIPRAQVYFGHDGVFGVLAAGSAALAVAFLAAA